MYLNPIFINRLIINSPQVYYIFVHFVLPFVSFVLKNAAFTEYLIPGICTILICPKRTQQIPATLRQQQSINAYRHHI
ncbi:hypothetical protein Halhy_5613 [Haliscomenobacter hydrossis DSM 1100]|uniref:Uncharacterized protein n=1 Tax=Haliscomenobacter hydrossis (strain ATCC 27775 / DSM 1100 / LMG 10767 / O) TaxID=760192 RepID=F4KUN4_HALH1|nr:hypothetical protein Halhy_5613 [Haliscomenobacter hydrossis DSM 1100]